MRTVQQEEQAAWPSWPKRASRRLGGEGDWKVFSTGDRCGSQHPYYYVAPDRQHCSINSTQRENWTRAIAGGKHDASIRYTTAAAATVLNAKTRPRRSRVPNPFHRRAMRQWKGSVRVYSWPFLHSSKGSHLSNKPLGLQETKYTNNMLRRSIIRGFFIHLYLSGRYGILLFSPPPPSRHSFHCSSSDNRRSCQHLLA